MPKKARPIVTIDCETDPFEFGVYPEPFLWVAYDGREYYVAYSTTDFFDFLAEKDWICYAHNGGKFDYHMPGILDRVEIGDQIKIISGRVASFRIGACEFRDSYSILPVPLKAHKKDDISYELFKKHNRDKHMDAITDYCKNDCKYLHELVMGFCNTYGRHLTLAGAAFNYWKNKYNKGEKPVSNRFYNEVMREYYYGGRVECFKKGRFLGRIDMIDINSAYPKAMMEEHPKKVELQLFDGKPESIIGRNLYHVKAISRGALIFRGEESTYYPDDDTEREYKVTGWELLCGIETKTLEITDYISYYHFEESLNFSGYVDHFFALKNTAKEDSLERLFAKLMLNSLYGKFATDVSNYSTYCVEDGKLIDDKTNLLCRLSQGKVITASPIENDDGKYYNTATAASITGLTRANLWRAICQLRAAGCVVYYCDTDSIMFSGEKPESIKISKTLGEWSYVSKEGYDEAVIAGKKMYGLRKKGGKDKVASKGVKASFDDIASLTEGHQVTYRRDAPSYSVRYGARFVERTVKMT